jgi:transcription initiation factor TFIIIB Brf1 subunit/transcription initiation factor TFIIB
MSRTHPETRGGSFCSHQNTIDNVRDGEQTCLDCGTVVDQLYGGETHYQQSGDEMKEDEIHFFIKDVCFNACLPSNIIPHTEKYYLKLCEQLGTSSFKRKTLAAFALYETLNRFEIPRMVEEIEYYTGIKMKDIWRVEANIVTKDTLSDPKHYVQRYCSLLQFSYSDTKHIESFVTTMETELKLGNVRCNCLVAVVIYLFCKEAKKKVSLKRICETCSISATSVHRVIRMLKMDCRSDISQINALGWIEKHLK